MGESHWQKDSLVTFILFELCHFSPVANFGHQSLESTGHQKGDDICPDAQAYLQTKLPTLAFNPAKSFKMRKSVQKKF